MQLMTDRSTTCTQTLNPKPSIAKPWRCPNSRSLVIRPVTNWYIQDRSQGFAMAKTRLSNMPLNPNPDLIKGRIPRLPGWIASGMQSCKRKTHKILHLKQKKPCNGTQICAIWVKGEKSGVTFGDGVFWNQNSCSNFLDFGLWEVRELHSRRVVPILRVNCNNFVGGFPTFVQIIIDSTPDWKRTKSESSYFSNCKDILRY